MVKRARARAVALGLTGVMLLSAGFMVGHSMIPEPEKIIMTKEVPVVINVEAMDEQLYDIPLDDSLQAYINQLCRETNVPSHLVLAIIEQESGFRTDAQSSTGDYGLMQINEINKEWLQKKYGVTDMLDPYQNILCGVNMIATYLDKYENLHHALMCYNMGEAGANKAWEQGTTSTSYTESVLNKMLAYGETNE